MVGVDLAATNMAMVGADLAEINMAMEVKDLAETKDLVHQGQVSFRKTLNLILD